MTAILEEWISESEAMAITGLSKSALRNRRARSTIEARETGRNRAGVPTGYEYLRASVERSIAAIPPRASRSTVPARADRIDRIDRIDPSFELQMAKSETREIERAALRSEKELALVAKDQEIVTLRYAVAVRDLEIERLRAALVAANHAVAQMGEAVLAGGPPPPPAS